MPNRTLCAVLEEMRKCWETRNFAYLPGLIEEAQVMGNRMEGALWDQGDFERRAKEYKEQKKLINDLKEKAKELSAEVDK